MPDSSEAAASLARAALRQVTGLAEARPFLEGWPALTSTRPQAPRSLPVCRVLGRLASLAVPETQGLVDELVTSAALLEWRQTYSAGDFGAAFLEGYGWTELVGLRGPIASTQLACGFLLLGPGIAYPAHAHEAEELYLPLAGTAQWQKGGDAFAPRPPGTPIVHRSLEAHATSTGHEPMLALYVWRGGDLAAKSKILR